MYVCRKCDVSLCTDVSGTHVVFGEICLVWYLFSLSQHCAASADNQPGPRTYDCPKSMVSLHKSINPYKLIVNSQHEQAPSPRPGQLSNHSALHNTPDLRPHNVVLYFDTASTAFKCQYFSMPPSQIIEDTIKPSCI